MKLFGILFLVLLTLAASSTIVVQNSFASAAAIRNKNKNPLSSSLAKKTSHHHHHQKPILSSALLSSSKSSSSPSNTVQVIAKYMEADLDGVSFVFVGTQPFSWDVGTGIPMTRIAKDTFSCTFDISSVWGNLTNTSTWNMEFKIVGVGANNFEAWELGRNHRLSIQKGDSNRQPKIVCPYFNTKTGNTQTIKNVYSPQLNNTRDVWIYIPAQLVENSVCNNEVEVLLMHDGQNLQPLWYVNEHLDSLIMNSDIPPILVIGPYNMDSMRIYEYTYSCCAPSDPTCGEFSPSLCGGGDKYLDFIDDTLMPEAQKYFPTVNFTLKNRGMLGSSLGGLITCYAGVTRPATFSRIGCMSSSFWWNKQDFLHKITPKLTPINSKTQLFYMDTGDSCSTPGDAVDDQPQTSAVITKFMTTYGGMENEGKFELGQNLFWYLERGAWHNEKFWSERFPTVMQYMYGRNMFLNNPGSG